MLDDDPVSVWLDELRQGEDAAARKIWQHFVTRLQQAARKRLHPDTRRVYDEQDAAQSAFNSLCAGVAAGRFPDLKDREGLWRLLVVITSRKVSRRHDHDRRERRDIRRNATDSVFVSADADNRAGVATLPSREPTPEYTLEFVETCERLFNVLEDPKLHQICRLKIEGYSNVEIANEMDLSQRTIRRKVECIRRVWLSQEQHDLR